MESDKDREKVRVIYIGNATMTEGIIRGKQTCAQATRKYVCILSLPANTLTENGSHNEALIPFPEVLSADLKIS